MFANHIYLIYMYKEDLALNNLQWLIWHKTKPDPTNIHTYIHKYTHTHTHTHTHIYIYIYIYIYIISRMFNNGPGDQDSIQGRVIPKTQKMVLDAALLNTQHYEVQIKSKVEQSRERSSASPTPWYRSYWKGSLWVPSTTVTNFTYLYIYIYIWTHPLW